MKRLFANNIKIKNINSDGTPRTEHDFFEIMMDFCNKSDAEIKKNINNVVNNYYSDKKTLNDEDIQTIVSDAISDMIDILFVDDTLVNLKDNNHVLHLFSRNDTARVGEEDFWNAYDMLIDDLSDKYKNYIDTIIDGEKSY